MDWSIVSEDLCMYAEAVGLTVYIVIISIFHLWMPYAVSNYFPQLKCFNVLKKTSFNRLNYNNVILQFDHHLIDLITIIKYYNLGVIIRLSETIYYSRSLLNMIKEIWVLDRFKKLITNNRFLVDHKIYKLSILNSIY